MVSKLDFIVKLLAACFILSIPSAVFGQNLTIDQEQWCHADFEAEDGTKIRVDYQIMVDRPMRGPYTFAMQNIYMHIENETFTGEEDVSVVFVWHRTSSASVPATQWDGTSYTVFGEYDHPNFSTPLKVVFPIIGYSDNAYHGHFEAAVVVDGRWLRDPISQTSNFKFYADRYDDLCANPY